MRLAGAHNVGAEDVNRAAVNYYRANRRSGQCRAGHLTNQRADSPDD
jgi:hypothetical protein